jgi:two-component system sensor histidine kinase BaeS
MGQGGAEQGSNSSISAPPVSCRGKAWRVGLIPKLVLSAILVLVVMISGLVMALYSTFETNLSAYLKRVETEEIAPLADLLGQEYARSGGWDYLTTSRQTWPMMVAQVLDKKIPASGDRSETSMDVIGMLPRLTVHDADGRWVIRSPLPPRQESNIHQVTLPVMANGERVGTLLMVPTPIPVKGLDRKFRDDQLHAFYLAALPALLITLLLAIPLGYHFARPVQRLARGIHRLARGDYKTRLDERRNDELGELARDFNYLASVLESSELQRREGMASVSHELRTPLATMITAVEAMQDGIRPLNAEQLQRLSGTMDHLNQLVDDLYQLALADVGKLVCRRERIAWDSVIDDAVDAMRGKLEERGLTIHCALEHNIAVLGDSLRLRQVVINLLENCHRYTEADGTIQIRLLRVGRDARMTIGDSGPGVGSDHLVTLFERFTRVDASRSREHGGAGLGLALVKAIAEAHGGKATAAIGKEGGLEITLSIPLAE